MIPFSSGVLIRKDALARVRGLSVVAILTAGPVALAAVLAVFLTQNSGPTAMQTQQFGAALLQTLAAAQLLLLLIAIPLITAGVVCGERRRRTWELLLVSRLSSVDILVG